MNEDHRERVDRVFNQARQIPDARRGEFVERACEADSRLREEVLSLLEADAAAGTFMSEPALERLARSLAADGSSLSSGESIGPYTVVQRLGSGGAGEVWRARDERLGRDVAIKVLLPHFAADADRLRRFADEARAASALNHSNILTVYDVGEHRGMPYLVSECLEGQSLRDRLSGEPVPPSEAIGIALDIARGLSAAHARGIVHRDLKPENVFLRSDGAVKILDFGLAKLQVPPDGLTATLTGTLTGVIAGTAGYMAPEQIKNEAVDARVDLFALGVILYEMLAGRHPFRRGSAFETLHAVLMIDPENLASIAPRVSPALAGIVMRLLDRAPDARFHSARDVIWALEQQGLAHRPAAQPHVRGRAGRPPTSRLALTLTAATIATIAAAAGFWLFARPDPAAPGRRVELTQFTWPLPPDVTLASAPAVSPDSRHIAFAGYDGTASRLYVRGRGAANATAIPGTEGASHPFWSPDSTSIGFFARDQLRILKLDGGAPVARAAALFPFGGAWGRSGTILFAPDVIMTGLSGVPDGGGAEHVVTALEMSQGDTSHAWPVFMPDGTHFLYFVRSADDDRRGLYVNRSDRSPESASKLLLKSDSNVVFVPDADGREGELLYVTEQRIEARRFNVGTLTLGSAPRTLSNLVAAGTTLTQPAMLSASADVLAFATATIPYGHRMEAVERDGRRVRLWEHPEAQNWPRLSPDGRYLARQRVDDPRNTPDLWVEDLERGTIVRVTTALEPDCRPVWSPDGRYLAYVTGNIPRRTGRRVLNIAAADGTGIVKTLPCPSEYCEPTDWTSGELVVNTVASQTQDVWLVPIESGEPRRLLGEGFVERDARVSPNGQWFAYVSSESGRPQVSIRTLKGDPKRIPVSSEGGDHPVWRRDGSELFFVDPQGQLVSVPVTWTRGSPSLGVPAKVNVPPIGRAHWGTPYDVSPDGKRIYLLRRNNETGPREIHVVIGWRALIN